MTATAPTPAHPRSRSMESWRGRKAVLASRGEDDGPRVAECDAALSWWRIRSRLVKELGISEERAESLLDLIVPQADADAAAVEPSEAAETGSRHDDLPAPDSPASVAQRQPESPSNAEPAETDGHSVTAVAQ